MKEWASWRFALLKTSCFASSFYHNKLGRRDTYAWFKSCIRRPAGISGYWRTLEMMGCFFSSGWIFSLNKTVLTSFVSLQLASLGYDLVLVRVAFITITWWNPGSKEWRAHDKQKVWFPAEVWFHSLRSPQLSGLLSCEECSGTSAWPTHRRWQDWFRHLLGKGSKMEVIPAGETKAERYCWHSSHLPSLKVARKWSKSKYNAKSISKLQKLVVDGLWVVYLRVALSALFSWRNWCTRKTISFVVASILSLLKRDKKETCVPQPNLLSTVIINKEG